MQKNIDLERKFVYHIDIKTNIHLQRGDNMRKFVFMLVVFNQVRVLKGDTYWDIAGRFSSDGMTREEYTEYIMEFNNAENDSLMAGQSIIVPVIEYV